MNYTALAGSVSPIQKDVLALAAAGQDFVSVPDTVLMGDGVKSVVITVNIVEVDDDVDDVILNCQLPSLSNSPLLLL